MNEIEHLYYMNYLAEQEMMNQIYVLKVKSASIHETSELLQLNEDTKEVVMNYIRKIISNIQEVWNKFKNTISSEVDLKRIEAYRKYFETDFVLKIPEGFSIPIMDEYQKMIAEKIPAFQESMLDELSDEKEFTRKYFNYFYDEKKSVKEVADSKVIKIAEKDGKDTIDKTHIAKFVKFIEDYKTNADNIANDIKNLNNSSRSIETLVGQTTVNASASFEDTYQYYFNEADEKETFNSVNKDEKEENKNNNQKGESEDKKKNSEISSKINTYFRICNSILSAKLSSTNKIRSSCTTLITQFGKLQENKKQPEDNKKENTDNQNKSNDATEVKL